MPAEDLTGHFAETWSYLTAMHAGDGSAEAAAAQLAANEEAQQLLEWQQEQEQQRFLVESAGMASMPNAASAALLGSQAAILAAWANAGGQSWQPQAVPPAIQPVIRPVIPAVPAAFRAAAGKGKGKVVPPPVFDGGLAWAAGPGAGGLAGGAAWAGGGGIEDEIMTAVGTAFKDVPAIQKEGDIEALKRKVVKMFRRANKGINWSEGLYVDRINEYADYVFGTMSWSIGECEWLPEVDFTIVLETAVHEFFPPELLADVSPIDLEETILKAHDRAFEEKRIEPVLREAVQQLLDGKKAQNRAYNTAEAGRKEALVPSMRAITFAAEYQGGEEELEGFSWDKVREFMSGWIHGTVRQLYIQAGERARDALSTDECHKLFSKLVQDGAIPRSIMLDLGIPVPDPWPFISAAVNDAYGTNDVLFPPSSRDAWTGLTDPQPKEEICFYFEMGKCTFGNNCFGAHGDHELRGRGALNGSKRQRVKTKLCPFFMRGKCTFADGCMNAHGEAELRVAAEPSARAPPADGEAAEDAPQPSAAPRYGAKGKSKGGPKGKDKGYSNKGGKHKAPEYDEYARNHQAPEYDQWGVPIEDVPLEYGKGGKGGTGGKAPGYDQWGVPVEDVPLEYGKGGKGGTGGKGGKHQGNFVQYVATASQREAAARWKGGRREEPRNERGIAAEAGEYVFDEDAEPPLFDRYGGKGEKGRGLPRAPQARGPDPLRDAFEEQMALAQGDDFPPPKRSRMTYGR